MDITGMTITLGSLITIATVVIALSNFFGSKTKKAKDEEARLVRIEAMLAQIEYNTNNLNQRVENHDHLLTKHESRISVVESKLKNRGGK
jgi:flagellar basal body-associated protein FliL